MEGLLLLSRVKYVPRLKYYFKSLGRGDQTTLGVKVWFWTHITGSTDSHLIVGGEKCIVHISEYFAIVESGLKLI